MFIRFHLDHGLAVDGRTVRGGDQRIDDLHGNADRPPQLHIGEFSFENAPSDGRWLEPQSIRNLRDRKKLLARDRHSLSCLQCLVLLLTQCVMTGYTVL